MKHIYTFLCLFLLSGVAHAGVGDKYICEVLTYTEARHSLDHAARVKTYVLERDYEDGLYYYFFLDWASEKTAQISRIKIYKGVPKVLDKWKIPIGPFPTPKSMEGFSGRHRNSFETLQITFNEKSGSLLLHVIEGSGQDLMISVVYEIRNMKCVKAPVESLDAALLSLQSRKWPKHKNTERNLVCNLKTLSNVGIYFAGGNFQTSHTFQQGAANPEIYKYLIGSSDAYERMLVDHLKHQLPMLKVYLRGDPEATTDDNQEDKVTGNFSCGIWTTGKSTKAIGLNVSCSLLVNYDNWHTRESYESYERYDTDFPVTELMGVVSRERLGDTIAAFIKAATTESALAFYKKRETNCKDP